MDLCVAAECGVAAAWGGPQCVLACTRARLFLKLLATVPPEWRSIREDLQSRDDPSSPWLILAHCDFARLISLEGITIRNYVLATHRHAWYAHTETMHKNYGQSIHA